MTALTDAKAVAPNATAKAALAVKGHDAATMTALIQQHAAELKSIVSTFQAAYPTSGDSTTLTALNTLLAELA